VVVEAVGGGEETPQAQTSECETNYGSKGLSCNEKVSCKKDKLVDGVYIQNKGTLGTDPNTYYYVAKQCPGSTYCCIKSTGTGGN